MTLTYNDGSSFGDAASSSPKMAILIPSSTSQNDLLSTNDTCHGVNFLAIHWGLKFTEAYSTVS